jgi:glutamate synthase (NADPH/NADH) small chain
MTITAMSETGAGAGRPHVTVLADRCAGCQECVIRCPTGALSMDTGRWVALAEDALCVGCRQCVRTCPFSAITVDGPLLVADRAEPGPACHEALLGDVAETRQGIATWDEALVEAERCLACPDPTCVRGCPAHNDIPGFIAALKDHDLQGAHQVLLRTTVLPDICSRVCNQAAQCEGACTWSLAGGTPVAIGRLERFVTDHSPVPPPRRRPAGGQPLSVGIVGAGPAGIGAAWELIEAGAAVTVYERDATPGGLCDWGIPDFTLPDVIAGRPWHQLTEAGADLRCGTEIRPENLDRLLTEHDAVILAHGAGVPLRLPVPGAELDGVTDATAFLQGAKAALAEGGDRAAFLASLGLPGGDVPGSPGGQVLVLGAGNTAMDVARSARRLGLDSLCVDWLDERFALARPDELDEARREGVEVRFCRTLTRIEGEHGRVTRAELAQTTQTRAGRSPKVRSGRPEVLDVDLVVMAMGYRADPAFAPSLPDTPLRREASGLADRRWMASGILAGPASAYANHSPAGRLALGREVGLWAAALPIQERLWAVGDALVGPSTVVEAMAQGKRAAQAVLDARPARPGGLRSGGPRRVLVCYESRGGRTARAAEIIAGSLRGQGAQVRTLPISQVGLAELAAADLVVAGSWVEGLVVAKVGPARAMRTWLASLPRLGGKQVAVFCTYRAAPKRTLATMTHAFTAKGAVVRAEAAFGPADIGPAATAFGRQVVAAAWSPVPSAHANGKVGRETSSRLMAGADLSVTVVRTEEKKT